MLSSRLKVTLPKVISVARTQSYMYMYDTQIS